jgi:hypothetical protein
MIHKQLIFSILAFGTIHLISCQQTIKIEKKEEKKENIESKQEIEEVEDTISYETLKKEYMQNYSKTIKFDTIIVDKSQNNIKISTKYYCLFDNRVTIPKKYAWEDVIEGKDFITHNYCQDVKVTMNDKVIFDKVITKEFFKDKIYTELKQYGVLLYPSFNYDTKNEISNLSYSISIPLTDIGIGVKISIDNNGKEKIDIN